MLRSVLKNQNQHNLRLSNKNPRSRFTRSLCSNSDALSDRRQPEKRLPLHYVAWLDRDLRDESLDEKTKSEQVNLFETEPIVEYSLTNFTNFNKPAVISS